MDRKREMHNESLYRALREYAQAGLTLIGAQLRAAGVPLGRDTRPITQLVHPSCGYRPADLGWEQFVWQLAAPLQALQSYRAAVQAMQNEPAVARHLDALVGTADSQTRMEASMVLGTLLVCLLAQGGVVFDERVFRSLYVDLEGYFHADTAECRYFAPVYGLQMERDRLELGDKFALVRLTQEERQARFARQQSGGHSSLGMGPSEFAFELLLVSPKHIVEFDSTNTAYVEFTARHPTETLIRLTAWLRHELQDVNQGWRVSIHHSTPNPHVSEQPRQSITQCARDFLLQHPMPDESLQDPLNDPWGHMLVDICEDAETQIAIHLEPWPCPPVMPAEFVGFVQHPHDQFPRLLGPVRRKIQKGQLTGEQPTVAVINLASGEVGEQLLTAAPVWEAFEPLVRAVPLYDEVDVIILVWLDWKGVGWSDPLVFATEHSAWASTPEGQALVTNLMRPLG